MRRYLLLLIGTALLVLYAARLDWAALFVKTRTFPATVAVAIVALNLGVGAVKTVRWKRFLAREGIRVGFGPAFLAVHAAFFMGLVTPGTAGEFARAASLDTGRGSGIAILVFEKLCDLGALAVLAALTVGGFAGGPRVVAAIAAGILAATAVSYYVWTRHRGFVLRPLRRLLGRMLDAEGVRGVELVYARLSDLLARPRMVAASLLYSTALWALSLVQVVLIYRGLALRPAWSFVAVSYFVPYLIGIVSLVPLGIGAFELSLRQLAASATAGLPAEVGALVPAFFRAFITVPLVLFGYGCQVGAALVRRSHDGAGPRSPRG